MAIAIFSFGCTADGTNAQDGCKDGIQNDGETSVDCGGPCAACAGAVPGGSSKDPPTNGSDEPGETPNPVTPGGNGELIETCADGVENNGELGLDCGGPCPACLEPLSGTRIPGKIEAEDFDAYHDSTSSHSGDCGSGPVDMQTTSDVDGGCNIGWVTPGEWLEYNVEVPAAGNYDITLRLASADPALLVAVSVGGTNVGMVKTSGDGSQSFEDRTLTGIPLPTGVSTVRVTFVHGGSNLNWLSFTESIDSSGVVTVSSIDELKEYLDDDNVHVVMSPGTYTITPADGATDVVIGERARKVLLYFEGNESKYDFTGVTIRVETTVAQSLGASDVYEVNIAGNNNILKNLTLIDDGDVHDAPSSRATNIVVDGAENRLEGLHMTTKGSYPYGYGDAFGKGGGPVISHRKRSGLLVRGESNHVLNCLLTHRSYGHALFMQAASNPIIQGCYIEGEVRSTNDMLAEEGTGSPADEVDFQTTWGYRLPPGHMMSLGEAGVRAYGAGVTVIDGVERTGATSNPTVFDCTIKHMRKGIGLHQATGKETILGCTSIGCETAYDFDGSEFTNNTADVSYGPAFVTVSNGQQFSIKIIQSLAEPFNGSGSIGFLGGNNQYVTITGDGGNVDEGLTLLVGGGANRGRDLAVEPYTASGATVENFTEFSVLLTNQSSSATGESCGTVTDEGTGNNVSSSTQCD